MRRGASVCDEVDEGVSATYEGATSHRKLERFCSSSKRLCCPSESVAAVPFPHSTSKRRSTREALRRRSSGMGRGVLTCALLREVCSVQQHAHKPARAATNWSSGSKNRARKVRRRHSPLRSASGSAVRLYCSQARQKSIALPAEAPDAAAMTAAPPPATAAPPRLQIEQSLEQLLQTLLELGICEYRFFQPVRSC